ncbi:DUF2807 domain-containing protein [Cryomorphaceae bacterium 1068]|nr:DUF2807 domain-containing protein [Cryomorphaceae bacterium 1068]
MRKVVIISLLLITASCGKENRWDCFKSYGDKTTETRTLGEFDSVFLESNIDVEYHYSTDYLIEVVFGDNIIEHIKTDVEDGELKISNETTCNWVRDLSKRPLAKIYAPTLAYMENRCSGDITFVDTLYSDEFIYEQWESNGVANFLVENDLTIVKMHVGYCDVTISGNTGQAEFYSASVGRLRARNLISPITLSNNTSIQDMELYAADYLYAEINLNGDIRYAGEPEEIDENISGSGMLSPL